MSFRRLIPFACLLSGLVFRSAVFADCDGNGITDQLDITEGRLSDCDADGIPDSCELEMYTPSLSAIHEDLLRLPADRVIATDVDGDGAPEILALANERVTIVHVAGAGGPSDPIILPVIGRPAAAAIGDLDGDGDGDLVVGSNGSSLLAWWPNDGGGFSGRIDVPATRNQREVALGDVDQDGDVDILAAVGLGVGRISLFENDGGEFIERAIVDEPDDALVSTLVQALDLDTDGDLDIACALVNIGGGPSLLLLLANDGSGAFSEVDRLETDESVFKAGDVDSDGLQDIVAIASNLRVFFIRGAEIVRSDRSFPSESSISFGAFADLDADGRLDLIGAAYLGLASGIHFYWNSGDGTFVRQALSDLPADSLDAADFDGDGLIDIAGTWGGVAIFRTELRPAARDCNLNGIPDACELAGVGLSAGEPALVGKAVPWAASGDFDDDGFADLAADVGSVLVVARSRGDGTFETIQEISEPAMARIIAAEIDGAPGTDVVGSTGIGLVALLAQSDGTLLARPESKSPESLRSLAAADLDGDGDVDVVGTGQHAFVTFINRDGRGVFDARVFAAPDIDPRGDAGDLDGDGRADIVAGDRVYWNDGEAGFSEALELATANSAGPAALGAADPGGRRDLIVADTHHVAVLRSRAGSRGLDQIDNRAVPNISWIALRDIDGDGLHDLMAASALDRLSVFPNGGDGRFREPAVFHAGSGGPWGAVEDFNGDGAADVAISDADGICVLLSKRFDLASDCDRDGLPDGCSPAEDDCDGDGSLDSCETSPRFAMGVMRNVDISPRPVAIALADLDSDGDLDVVAGDEEDRMVVVLTNDGGGRLEPAQHVDTRRDLKAIAAGDFNGDGYLDIVAGGSSVVLLENVPSEGEGDGSRTLMHGGGISDVDDVVALRAVDADSDGDFDLAFSAYLNELGYLRNDGGNAFSLQRVAPASSEGRSFVAADLDGDGTVDLASVGKSTGRVSVLRGVGDGTFAMVERFEISPLGGELIAAGDTDADGTSEIIVTDGFGSGPPSTTIFHELEGGRLQVRATLDLEDDPLQVAVGDVDGDGRGDILVGLGGRIVPFVGTAVGALRRLAPRGIRSGGLTGLALGDLDGNGQPDLVAAVWLALTGSVVVLLNESLGAEETDCDGDLRPDHCQVEEGAGIDADQDGVPDLCQGSRQVPGDCTQDGRADASDAICILSVLFLGEPTLFPCGTGGRSDPAAIALLDWQADGAINVSDGVAALYHLFLGGPGHALHGQLDEGIVCVPIPGCPDIGRCGPVQ
jgi:hypothetical protein